MSDLTFDYIVVGAGTAGAALAARLSESPTTSVLLLEAGGSDRGIHVNVPLAFPRISQRRMFDWGLNSEPVPGLNGRKIALPRGRIIGGSSSINGMVHVRGNARDFDGWAENGAPGWSAREVLPYFRRMEDWQGEAKQSRGNTGPITVRECGYQDPLNEAFRSATGRHGMPANDDYNDGEQIGYAKVQQAIDRGRRASSSRYLAQARGRPNLRILTHAEVAEVVLVNRAAKGVRFRRRGGEVRLASALREVILCGGALKSPHLLMLSGIGPGAALRAAGVEPVVDLPGVGRNLRDHVVALNEYERRDDGPFMRELRWDRLLVNTLRAYLQGKGPASDIPSCGLGFARIDTDAEQPQVQFLFRAASRLAAPWLPLILPQVANRYGCSIWLLHPKSTGHLELDAGNPAGPLKVHENYFADPDDLRVLREGLRLARRVCFDPAFDGFRGEEEMPGGAARSDEELDAYLRANASTAHHPVGTCRMGSDEGAVVDPQLRVRGVTGLRVVDASVMPTHVSGNTNAPTLMIAERAADLIRGVGT